MEISGDSTGLVTVRFAADSDVDKINSIAYNTWFDCYGDILSDDQINYMLEELYCESVLKDLISNNYQKFLILDQDNAAKAFASFGSIENGNFKLFKIYVLPECQGKGFGNILMQEVIKQAASGGGQVLELNVNRNNKALYYYRKIGFEIIKEVDIAIGPYWMNDFVMQLKL